MGQNTWEPSHCKCRVTYKWDDSIQPEERVITLYTVNSACPYHRHLEVPYNLYACLIEETQRISRALEISLNQVPQKLADVIEGTESTYILKPSIGYITSFSGTAPNRKLTISFEGSTLDNADIQNIQSMLNNIIGAGLVAITLG